MRTRPARWTPILILQGVQELHRPPPRPGLPVGQPVGMQWRLTFTTTDARPDEKNTLRLPGLTPSDDDPRLRRGFADLTSNVERAGHPPVAYADYFDDTDG